MATSANPNTGSSFNRLSEFVKVHRRSLLISLTIIAAATAGTIYLTYPNSGIGFTSAKDRKRKKDKKKKNRKKSSAPGSKNDDSRSSNNGLSTPRKSEESSEENPLNLTKSQIESLSAEERERYAFILKTNGNKAYQSKKYEEALECYSKAIECEEKAVYYSNRAACYTNLKDSEAVIRDCTEALRLDKHYIKALNRRAAARELLGGEENLFLALCDFTACVILDEFKTDTKGATADRVMKRYATEKAQSILKQRGPRLPSPMIIRAYLDAFRQKPRPDLPSDPNQADHTLMLAHDALDAFDYSQACNLFNEVVEQEPSTPDLRAHARMMKATFLFLMGQSQPALEEFDRSISEKPDLLQAWVRKASVDMELGSLDAALRDFSKAIEINPDDPDVYYHRGQVYNVTEQHQEAIEDYRRSIELDPSFVFSHVQLAVAIYKTGEVAKAMEMFKEYLNIDGKESTSPEVHNYFGELLFAEQSFDEALERFESAISLEEKRPGPKNVLPWVNKALVYGTAKSDIQRATECCLKAIEIDDSCEVAIQQLAQFKLQNNETREAINWYEKGIQVAMTEIGLVQLLQFEAAAKAQLSFIENYPEYAARLGL
ncbi:mitochondrial protein import receptor [Phakopsora pachyrhizi]|nr:mitochondrial protein import receptor [Phakopsora pachyrhizi]